MKTTFYNADRTQTAVIDFAADFEADCGFNEHMRACCEIILDGDTLADFFGIEYDENDYDEVDQKIDDARRVGDRVYFIGFKSTRWDALQIKPTLALPIPDGVIIVHAGAWKSQISPIYTSAFVGRAMDRIAKWAEAYLNGTAYEVRVSRMNDCDYIRGPFLTKEEAEEELHSEFPEIRFTDEDFDCVCTYTLKPEAAARLPAA